MNKLNKILFAVQGVAALCMLGAVKIWAPVCGKMLQLVSGMEVHMKCFYSGQAAIAIAIILLALAIVSFLAKKDFKKVQIAAVVTGVVLFLVFDSLIGVCANAEMRCNTTALWGKIVSAVTVITALVNLFSGKEGQIPD